MRIVKEPRRCEGGATLAQVSFSHANEFGAVGAAEQRGVPLVAPRGISWRPCEGDRILLLPVDGADVCAGVLSPNADVEAGELRFGSCGGASILLRKNGDVVINGLVITKDGRILEKEAL